MSIAPTPPAGWFPDPTDSQSLRWWNGVSWTEHTTLVPGSTRPPDNPWAVQPTTPVGKTRNPLASTGLGLGIASVFLFSFPYLGLLLAGTALGLSIVGLVQSPTRGSGHGVSIAGIVLGAIYLFMAIISPYRS